MPKSMGPDVTTAPARVPRRPSKLCHAAMLAMLVGCIRATGSSTPAQPATELEGWIESCKTASSSADESALRIAATNCHRAARALAGDTTATEQQQDLEARADAGYTAYLAAYPEDPNAYEVGYSYAELLSELGRYAASWQHYDAVVEQDRAGARAQRCAEAAIVAAEEVVKGEAAADDGSAPTSLSEWEEKLVASLDRYATLYPDDAKSVSVLYKAAFILYQHERYADSTTRFRKVIALDPTQDTAIHASHLVLDSFAKQGDWAGLRDAAKGFHEQADLGDESYKENIHSIYLRATQKLEE